MCYIYFAGKFLFLLTVQPINIVGLSEYNVISTFWDTWVLHVSVF
jgi:hypothetical protein